MAKVVDLVKTVATAGTGVPFVATSTYASALEVMAKKVTGANTGNVVVGISTVDKATRQIMLLEPGDYWAPPIPDRSPWDLSTLYLDADNNNDGIVGLYTEV